ncbi:MAG: hypothetical protein BZ137_01440 [Methanosphaera sp. rholeuAM130]|nr:LytTR family DNA-binding domain-containing protein [Methanosphaera sp.]RAP54576.1 MAG: hypothetical protein BZ137_01440 [Methanosphaera sp. rholeuAM130]
MKVELFLSKDIKEAYSQIHTDKITDNIQKAIELLEDDEYSDKPSLLAVSNGQDISLLDYGDIYMIRVENKQVIVYTQKDDYTTKKPLYQLEDILDSSFVRISKTTIINIHKINRVAPSFRGMMFVELKNDLKDTISRKYLPTFKESLDI